MPNSTPAIAELPEAGVAGGPLDERAAIPSINESVRDLAGAPDFHGAKLSLDNPVDVKSLTDFVAARMADVGKFDAAMLPNLEQKTVAYLRLGWALLCLTPQPKHGERREWAETVGRRLGVSARRVRDILGAARSVPQDKAHLVPRCAVQRPIEEVSRAVANWTAGRDWNVVGERPEVSKTEPEPAPEPEPEGDSKVSTAPGTETSASSSPEAGIEAEWWTEQNRQLWLRLTNLMAAEPQMIPLPTRPFVQAAKKFINSIVSDNRKMGAFAAAATRKRNSDSCPFGKSTPWEPGMPDTLEVFAPNADNDDEGGNPPVSG